MIEVVAPQKKKHPAPFRDDHIEEFARILSDKQVSLVLDPFAGVGKIHDLQRWGYETVGIEIEPEWAEYSPHTIVGDAIEVMSQMVLTFDAVVTSPVWGNRMSDTYIDNSRRHTYSAYLGRKVSDDSAGGMNWGSSYRKFHEEAWEKATDIVRLGGYFLLNIKDHIRAGRVIEVSKWHVGVLGKLGWDMIEYVKHSAPGQLHGANRNLRVDHEHIFVFQKAFV